MAFLPFLSYCLLVSAMRTLQGGFFICGDVSEEEDHDFSSLCQIAIKIWRFSGRKRKCQNIKRMQHLRRKGRRDGKCSIWTFCPLSSSRLENVPLPSYSMLHLTVVDFSLASLPTVTAIARVKFLASIKCNPLAVSLTAIGYVAIYNPSHDHNTA